MGRTAATACHKLTSKYFKGSPQLRGKTEFSWSASIRQSLGTAHFAEHVFLDAKHQDHDFRSIM